MPNAGDAEVKQVAKAKAPARATAKKTAAAAAGPSLVVVESPAKAKTLKKYLGSAYDVQASGGPVKDLPKSTMGVDVEKGFLLEYDVIKGKAKILSDMKRAAKKAAHVFLATDPDREGEAIAWHIAEELGGEGAADPKVRRVLLSEVTKDAIEKAIAEPLDLDRRKLDSQQARRILDRLVAYQLSPILWRKVRRGLSVGRVQSVAVRLIVEREREILAFRPVESWSLEADLAGRLPPGLRARLAQVDGQKADLADEESARAAARGLDGAKWIVASVEEEERRSHPPPPFTTAKLQQEAAKRLGFTARKTLTLAQRLYEGVELGDEGAVGLITYVRTDSVRLSSEAIAAARDLVAAKYGSDHLPAEPNVYETRQRPAQEAHEAVSQEAVSHEAVRPTSLEWTPERAEPYLEELGERDMFRLYELIWNRFVACQVVPAVHGETTADIAAGRATFRATGSILKRPGYLAVYGAQRPDERMVPALEAGMELRLLSLDPEQHFTEPPPRFDEPSLIEELEERGIGRPSTYAAILSAIEEKAYVERVEGSFKPTELGLLVTDELVRTFPREMDVAFTAGIEEKLDEIEEGKVQWQAVLTDFYAGFKEELEKAQVPAKAQLPAKADVPAKAGVSTRDVERPVAAAELSCEKCGKTMAVKWGRTGEFLACSGYPDCRNTKSFERAEDGSIQPVKEEEIQTDEACEKCGAPMAVRRGRFGRFLACTKYPACKHSKPISIGVTCPNGCGGYISERLSKRGKTFYGCSSYPKCDFVTWDRPRNEACPTCGSTYLLEKFSKKTGPFIACPHKECGYERQAGGASPLAEGEVPPRTVIDV